jgi:nucleotide-binding universal stress UspA family protein
MADAANKAVVVGFDGSDSARRAVWWAAHEASSRRRPLLLVHVFGWPFEELTPVGVRGEPETREPLLQAMRRELQVLEDGCRDIDPELEVRNELRSGDAAEVLGELIQDAELLVLGGPRIDGMQLGVIGSTSAELLARRAGSPVVVVRGDQDRPAPGSAPVVVGVDGSPASELASGFTFDFASRHGCDLVAVHAWSDLPLDPFARVQKEERDLAEVREEALKVLSESLAGWAERYPEVIVHKKTSPERPKEALLRESENASLLVVGSHGRGRIRRAVLGSVSHAAVNRAHCPVAVLRAQH